MPADHPVGASGVKEGAHPERLEGQGPVNTTGDDDALDRGKVAFSTVWIPAEASQVIEAGPGQACRRHCGTNHERRSLAEP